MPNQRIRFIRASVIIPLSITAVIVVLWLLPTPQSGATAIASTARPSAPHT